MGPSHQHLDVRLSSSKRAMPTLPPSWVRLGSPHILGNTRRLDWALACSDGSCCVALQGVNSPRVLVYKCDVAPSPTIVTMWE